MIKQGYHHIDIYKPYQKFHGFSWEVGGKTCYFVLTVLPFELTSAPFLFTKVMRCLVKHWKISAIRRPCFFDDGLGVASSYKMTLFHSNLWQKISTKRRFYYKRGKLCLENTSNFDLVMNKNKILKNLFLQYTNRNIVRCKRLGCITHWKNTLYLISMKFGLGDIVQLKTRNLYKVIENQWLWDSRMNLTNYEKAIKELIFWKSTIKFFNKKPLRIYDLPKTVIFLDASGCVTWAIFENDSGTHTCHKNLITKECFES